MKEKIQAVILAAGKGIRCQPLTNTRPKPLLRVLDKTVLGHNLEQLDGLVREVILVIGYQGEEIKKMFGSRHKSLKISYIWQKPPAGTGDAAQKAAPLVNGKFLLLNGDDVYDRADIKKCLEKFPSISLARAKNCSNFGVVSCVKNYAKGIIEKPEKAADNLVNTGLYFLPKSIFNFGIKKSSRGEYEFTDYINQLIKKEKLYWVLAKNWHALSCSWNLLDVNEFFLNRVKASSKGKVEKNCRIKGRVIIEKGALIKSGAYLEGPVFIGKNSKVGPNCYIRGPVSIGSDCMIGQAVEIKNSIIGDNSRISHLAFVGDSIIGNDCNLGAGTVIANLRFDGKTIKVQINGNLFDTHRDKFGAILGDGVKIGINTSVMPGMIIGQNAIIKPNSLVTRNVPDGATFSSNSKNSKKS